MAYEWMFGPNHPDSDAAVDPAVSAELTAAFAEYQDSLALRGVNGYGPLTAATYPDYLLRTYLQPAAGRFLGALSDADRSRYLDGTPWISWSDAAAATFGVDDFRSHVGRMKSAPAFDAVDLGAVENVLFGNATTDARHFTAYSLRRATGDPTAHVDEDLTATLPLMNPMHFLAGKHEGRARHWWLRVGTSDTHTSLTIVGNLAAALAGLGDDVDSLMYWDGDHDANDDAPQFIEWLGRITGYRL
jgi:hypothetical protein